MQAPPIAVVLALVAVLLAILAAARFDLRGAGAGRVVTLVIDRGMTMSGRGAKDLRFRETAGRVLAELDAHFPRCDVDLLPLPGAPVSRSESEHSRNALRALAPTAIDTRDALLRIVQDRLRNSKVPVIVVTDQALALSDPRLVEVAPGGSVQDLGIVAIAARERPAPQVMVRLRNHSRLRRAALLVSSGAERVERTVDLPASGSEQNVFVDMNGLGDVISAELPVTDDIACDKRAWLVREGSSPRIEAAASLPAELTRMIEVYQRGRPASNDSATIPVLRDMTRLPANGPAVILALPTTLARAGAINVRPHAATEHVNWTKLPSGLRGAEEAPRDWLPIVRIGDQTLIAARTNGPRQLWVGFDTSAWSTSVDFVIFWTDAFDWVGDGGRSYVGHSLSTWQPEWKAELAGEPGRWPGLYRRADGTPRAFNPPDAPIPRPAMRPWQARLASQKWPASGWELSFPLACAALASLAGAAATWRRHGTAAILPGNAKGATPAAA